MAELSKKYDPKTVEDRWYAHWEEQGYFHSEASEGGDPYTIVIPPPNVTGILHMGHALNNTIQDILIRRKRMQGFNTVWVPGTDHAGIATQNVVERSLRKEGKSRDDLGRDAFIEKVWGWREEYGSTITRQLRKLGAACDWQREHFTMDQDLSEAVAEVFVRLYEKGLVYKGNYIINWCPRCRTALSDEESEHQDTNGKLYYIRYPVKGGKRKDAVMVATTRPETLLGDVALAVNPRDERYKHLQDKTLLLPLLNRALPVIEDDFVDPEFGTGVVKVTPAHDPNDFDMGRRHDLTPINVMNEDGTMNEEAGPYAGLDRFECRKRIIADLEEAGLLERMDDHHHAVGHCYRCDTIVEPRLSPQWFVKMKPLARPAIDAVKSGQIHFSPDRWTKVYLEWMENIRDWCISRQIWWGHRVPVFYCDGCGHEWAARHQPDQCPSCQSADFRQDEDVLDTWFSSWLWPFSVFGWPHREDELKFYYPTDTLVTASEIIFFWVARMVMSGLEFVGEIPFSKVYIHGTVRDDKGRKMSKSLGNSIDPLDIIEKYSADALRFSLTMLTATGQDVYISDEKFELGRNFGTKIWNAARFMQMNTGDRIIDPSSIDFASAELSSDDQHILARLQQAIASCDDNLERFRFNDAAGVVYEFVWHQFCDWYVESAKTPLNGDDEAARMRVLSVMHYVFSNMLRMLHPFMPFITEELWHGLDYNTVHETIQRAPWPVALEDEILYDWGIREDTVDYVDAKHDLIRVGRTLKADCNLPVSKRVDYIIKPLSPVFEKRLADDIESLKSLMRAESITLDRSFAPGKAMPSGLSQAGTIYMPVDDLVDVEAETERLDTQLAKLNEDLDRINRKLDNLDFINKAPEAVVEQQRKRKQELLDKADKLRKLRASYTA